MSISPTVLFEAINPAASETVVFTATVKTIVTKFSGCNVGAAAMTVTVKVVNPGAAPSTVHIQVPNHALLPKETYGFPEIVGQVLQPGGSISVLPSTGDLNLRGCGTLVTS